MHADPRAPGGIPDRQQEGTGIRPCASRSAHPRAFATYRTCVAGVTSCTSGACVCNSGYFGDGFTACTGTKYIRARRRRKHTAVHMPTHACSFRPSAPPPLVLSRRLPPRATPVSHRSLLAVRRRKPVHPVGMLGVRLDSRPDPGAKSRGAGDSRDDRDGRGRPRHTPLHARAMLTGVLRISTALALARWAAPPVRRRAPPTRPPARPRVRAWLAARCRPRAAITTRAPAQA